MAPGECGPRWSERGLHTHRRPRVGRLRRGMGSTTQICPSESTPQPAGRSCPGPEPSREWGGKKDSRGGDCSSFARLSGLGRSRAGVGRSAAPPHPLVQRVELAVAPLHGVSAPAVPHLHSEHLPGGREQADAREAPRRAHPTLALKGTKGPWRAAAPWGPSHAPHPLGRRGERTCPPLRAVPHERGPSSAGLANPSAPKPSAGCPPTAQPRTRDPHWARRGEVQRVPAPLPIHCPRSPCGLSLDSAWAPRPLGPRTGCELPASAPTSSREARVLPAQRRDPAGSAPPLDPRPRPQRPRPGRSFAPRGLAGRRLGGGHHAGSGEPPPEPGGVALRVGTLPQRGTRLSTLTERPPTSGMRASQNFTALC